MKICLLRFCIIIQTEIEKFTTFTNGTNLNAYFTTYGWHLSKVLFTLLIYLFSRILNNNRLSPDLKKENPMLNMANRFIQKCVLQPIGVLSNKFLFGGHQNQTLRLNLFCVESSRKYSSETNGAKIPVVGYDEVKNLPKYPRITLIDVREPNELQETGSIPTSLNIPCEKIHGSWLFRIECIWRFFFPVGDIPTALSLSDRQFKTKYQRDKPDFSDEIIFHCKLGIRSENAAIAAMKLGYTK